MMSRLTYVISGCTVMTYGSGQRSPEGRTFEPRPRPVAAVRSTARCRGAIGARLFHFSAASLSLPTASPAVERTSPGERVQAGVHGKASRQFDSAGTVVRICQKNIDQRSREPGPRGALAARKRSWLSRSRALHAPFIWNIDSTVCCPTNSLRRISCWCLSGDRRSEEPPPNQPHLLRR